MYYSLLCANQAWFSEEVISTIAFVLGSLATKYVLKMYFLGWPLSVLLLCYHYKYWLRLIVFLSLRYKVRMLVHVYWLPRDEVKRFVCTCCADVEDRDLFSCCFVTDGAASRGPTVFGSSEICCQEISANIYLEKKYLKTPSRKKFSIIYEESSNP